MEECALRRLPKDILVKLISDIQDPDKMPEEYIDEYKKRILDSVHNRKISKVNLSLKLFFRADINTDIFDSLVEIQSESKSGTKFGQKTQIYFDEKKTIFKIRFYFDKNIIVKVSNNPVNEVKNFSVSMDGIKHVTYVREIIFPENPATEVENTYYSEEYNENVLGEYVKFAFSALTREGIKFMEALAQYLDIETNVGDFDEIFKKW